MVMQPDRPMGWRLPDLSRLHRSNDSPGLPARKGRRTLLCMAVPVEELTEEILALPADARAVLADRLVESLDPLKDDAVRGAWASEAVRRRDEIRSGKVAAIPGEAAAEQVRALLRK
jgi:putative addiction module component (TIGR02574 family)